MAIDLCKKNIGPTEKYIRIGAGGLLTVLAGAGIVGAWGFIGLVPLATGLLGSCPVYTLMGKDTNCGAGSCGGTAQAETHAHGGACCGGPATPAEPEAAATPEAPATVAEEPATPAEAAAETEASAEAAPTAEEKPAA